MKNIRFAFIASAMVAAASASAAPIWYNGDFDGVNGQNVGAFNAFDSRVYDDFNISGQPMIIDSVFMNVLSAIPRTDILTFAWEIRSGVSAGSGGTLVASGLSNATVTTTGRTGFGRPEYNVLATGLSVNLAPGTYWLGGKVGGNGTSNDMFVSTTVGANGIGTPLNNVNSFWDSTSFGASWQALANDYSMGVNGAPVPEPASMVALGLGALALVRRRRSK